MLSPLKPIAICQHNATQGPAYLKTFLDLWQLPYQIFAIVQGGAPPIGRKDYSALVLLGSNASVNDPHQAANYTYQQWLLQIADFRACLLHEPRSAFFV